MTGWNDFAREVHENAVAHGWWEEERRFPEVIALCHSESVSYTHLDVYKRQALH